MSSERNDSGILLSGISFITMQLSLTQQIFHVGRVKLGIFLLGTARVLYVVRMQFASGLKRLGQGDSVEGTNRFHFCVVRTGLYAHVTRILLVSVFWGSGV